MVSKCRLMERKVNKLILAKDKTALRAIAYELEDSGYSLLFGKCLYAIGDLDLIKDFYRKDPQVELLEAFFFIKKNMPFSTPPSWYLAKGTEFWRKYESWVQSKGCELRGMSHSGIASVVSGIESFAKESPQEKAVIAIANSGLYGGFLAKGLGVDTFVVDSHRKGNGTSYEERDDFNVTGKDVLIIDNDVSSGKTIKRVTREISKKHPKKISFLFYHIPS